MTDWGSLYRANLAAVTALAEHADQATLDTPVPASPDWTVRDVVAHLAGVAADQVDPSPEAMTDAPGPAWTARHLSARSGASITDLVAELRSHEDAMAALFAESARPAGVWDIAVHHADLHEALGRGRAPERLWAPIVDAVCPPSLIEGVDADAYELFRGRFSRRSRRQLAAWGLPPERVEAFGIFGPREDDQPIP